MLSGASEEAIRICSDVLDDNIGNPVATAIATQAFNDLGRPGFAALFGRATVEKFPQHAAAWINLGNAYQNAYNIEACIECQKKALEINPRDFAALNNIALSYVNLSMPDEAIRWCEEAEKIHPQHIEVLETKGYAQLMKHQWEEGWRNYNIGIGRSSDRKIRSYNDEREPVWKGEKGKTVVLYGEQGLGDELAFSSVVPQMRNDCNLIIETQAKLEKLFARSFVVPVYGTRYTHGLVWPEHHGIDAVISMGQAMELYRKKDEDFTGRPYLKADTQKRRIWRAILDTFPGRKVGLAWTGGTRRTGRSIRSAKLEDFLPMMKSGDTFVSLEYLDPSDEINELELKHGIKVLDFTRFLNHKEYDDTAALVAELDYVVCVTTAVADLCGALGRNADVLVPDRPHWRYYGEDSKTLWYDSLNLVRQQGTWEETIRRKYA